MSESYEDKNITVLRYSVTAPPGMKVTGNLGGLPKFGFGIGEPDVFQYVLTVADNGIAIFYDANTDKIFCNKPISIVDGKLVVENK